MYRDIELCFTVISDSYIIQQYTFMEIKTGINLNHCNGDRRSNFQIRLFVI